MSPLNNFLMEMTFAFPIFALLMIGFLIVSIRLRLGEGHLRLSRFTSVTAVLFGVACLPFFLVMTLGAIALVQD